MIPATPQQEPEDADVAAWRRAQKCRVCGYALHRPSASDGSWLRCGKCQSEWDAEEEPRYVHHLDGDPTNNDLDNLEVREGES